MVRSLCSSALLSLVLASSARADAVIDFQDLVVPAAGYFNGDPGGMPADQSWRMSTPQPTPQ